MLAPGAGCAASLRVAKFDADTGRVALSGQHRAEADQSDCLDDHCRREQMGNAHTATTSLPLSARVA